MKFTEFMTRLRFEILDIFEDEMDEKIHNAAYKGKDLNNREFHEWCASFCDYLQSKTYLERNKIRRIP